MNGAKVSRIFRQAMAVQNHMETLLQMAITKQKLEALPIDRSRPIKVLKAKPIDVIDLCLRPATDSERSERIGGSVASFHPDGTFEFRGTNFQYGVRRHRNIRYHHDRDDY
jgi:hypothetical protein